MEIARNQIITSSKLQINLTSTHAKQKEGQKCNARNIGTGLAERRTRVSKST
jgi:hypothetical protein